jgi:F0F1-type ATP synthase membrane subunit a
MWTLGYFYSISIPIYFFLIGQVSVYLVESLSFRLFENILADKLVIVVLVSSLVYLSVEGHL